MTSTTIPANESRLREIITRAAEFLCKESQHGVWQDARTNALCLWALCNCGLARTHTSFMNYCIRELLQDGIRGDDGLHWNQEIWDTAMCSFALKGGGGSTTSTRLSEIKHYILSLYSELEDNFENEPWETLWAVAALVNAGRLSKDTIPKINNSLSWVLNKRDVNGVLISPHYAGLFLFVLGMVHKQRSLAVKNNPEYATTIKQHIDYLIEEYEKKRKGKNTLWNEEPWSIGLILLGLSVCHDWNTSLLLDDDFIEFLTTWCDNNWNPSVGWSSVLDTAYLLVGLSEFYLQKALMSVQSTKGLRLALSKELGSRVKFKFKGYHSHRMVVHPFWKGRKFKTRTRRGCILMPFNQPWSDTVYRELREILSQHDFQAIRPDELHDREVLEGIWRSINEAGIIIADCTGGNLNVFYELGIAHTIGREVILICQDVKRDIPYDLHSQRIIEYDLENIHETLTSKLPSLIDYVLGGVP